DTVDADGAMRRDRPATRRAGSDGSDKSIRLDAAREDAPVHRRHGDYRSRSERNRVERVLQRLKIHEHSERSDGPVVVLNRVAENDVSQAAAGHDWNQCPIRSSKRA